VQRLKILIVVCSFLLGAAVFSPLAHASVWNQRMEFKFDQPIAVPGRVLPAGTYCFVLLESPSNREIVQIFNQDQTKLYGTFLTNAVDRQETTSRPEIEFAEGRHGNPEALFKIFYPSLSIGHEFVYPRRQERMLAQDVKQDIVVHRRATNSVVTTVGM
jgi:hypothetical protein